MAPVTDATNTEQTNIKAKRQGASALRINLNVAQPSGNGVNAPAG
jgi:hypothetical protein